MARLRERVWKTAYSPRDGDLVACFYNPLLACARRYDRTTGFYGADTLVCASRGIEAMLACGGKMRLLASCRLSEAEIAAIRRGESLAGTIEASLLANPLAASSQLAADGLELLAWLVANRHLEIRIGVMRDPRTGAAIGGIFHEKAGVVQDCDGERLAFSGSLNETLAGWKSLNWDTFHVFRSWTADCAHVDSADQTFQELWHNQAPQVEVLPLGKALERDLMRFLPPSGQLPARLARKEPAPLPQAAPEAQSEYEAIWQRVREGAVSGPGSEWVGMATAAIVPWPHQIGAFWRMYAAWPPRLLIADEVGLGKTIQAGLLLRQAVLAGRIRHALIMAPKAVLSQWQRELRDKFNLVVPIYEDGRLRWPDGATSPPQGRWQDEQIVLASAQLMRMQPAEACAGAWDLVIVDEAHHARRRSHLPGRDQPNRLLRLLRRLAPQFPGLILLTATPMQVHPLELWDLLNLLGLPAGWDAAAFLEFFSLVRQSAPDDASLAATSRLFRSMTEKFGPIPLARLERMGFSPLAAKRIITALMSPSEIPRKRLTHESRLSAMRIMAAHTPVSALVSRHTRELLRDYRASGLHGLNVARREVTDLMVELAPAERRIYQAVEQYIVSTWNQTPEAARTAVGFALTVYRRRLASSFAALAATLRRRLARLAVFDSDDLPDDDLRPDSLDDSLPQAAAPLAEEAGEIGSLLAGLAGMRRDSKASALLRCLDDLVGAGHDRVMIFTQFTDTMDWLSAEICARFGADAVLRYSGRGGEIMDDGWRAVSRDTARELFAGGKHRFLLCTDAAAEGLNFQFCGALVNYDMPWNPMRVEQRIGRIDRLGQKYDRIRIINLMYANTVETDIYLTLRQRIDLFGRFVGRLQPILARLPRLFERSGLSGSSASACAELETLLAADNFDIDAACADELALPKSTEPAWDLALLEHVLANSALLPPGYAARRLGAYDFELTVPGRPEPARVSLDRNFYANHMDSVEFWTPGSPLFPGYSQRRGE